MKKMIFIPILALICYLSTALYSFHQVHKSIYYNDKSLINEYVEWSQLRENFKNYLNIQLLKETQNNEDLKNLGGLSILITSVASKIVDNILDTYVNSEGLSMLLENNKNINDLPEPSFNTLIGGIKIMEFTGHSSFKIKHIFEQQEVSLLFERKGIDWKITQIEFPDNLFDDLKNSSLKNITNPFKDEQTTKIKNITTADINNIQNHIKKYWKLSSYAASETKIIITLKISTNRDGSVRQVSIYDKSLYMKNKLYRAAADAARRAVIESSPLPLPKGKEKFFDDFLLDFDTSYR